MGPCRADVWVDVLDGCGDPELWLRPRGVPGVTSSRRLR